MLDSARARAVAEAIKQLPPVVVDVVEARDPQLAALKLVARRHGATALALVVANALVSYRLSGRGEEYWREFGEWAASLPAAPSTGEEVIRVMKEFLSISRYNKLAVEQKLSRLRKAKPALDLIASSPEVFRDVSLVYGELRRSIGQSRVEKTTVFAAKMAYYYWRAVGVEVEGVEEVPYVPLDSRLHLLAHSSSIVPGRPSPRTVQAAGEAWRLVAVEAGLPPLRLDALLWLPSAGVQQLLRRGKLMEAREAFAKALREYSGGLASWGAAHALARQVIHRNPYV